MCSVIVFKRPNARAHWEEAGLLAHEVCGFLMRDGFTVDARENDGDGTADRHFKVSIEIKLRP